MNVTVFGATGVVGQALLPLLAGWLAWVVLLNGGTLAYNSAWDQYDEPEERRGDSSREETAHRVAWSAVKNKYEKDDETGKWKEK